MQLSDLAGEHILTGVDLSNERVKREYGDEYADATCLSFRLGDTTYTAIEDPGDGYRSGMREIGESDHPLANTFPGVAVVASHVTTWEDGGPCDMLVLTSVATGDVVLEVGTDNSDNYYPCFIAGWSPQNLYPGASGAASAEGGSR